MAGPRKMLLAVAGAVVVAACSLSIPFVDSLTGTGPNDFARDGQPDSLTTASEKKSGAVYYSRAIGWSDGENVTSELKAFLSLKTKSGDVLILEDTVEIDAGARITLPAGVTLTANHGAGIDIVDTAGVNTPALLLSDHSALRDLLITASDAPDTGFEGQKPSVEIDYHQARAVGIFEADQVEVTRVSFSGNLAMFIDVRSSSNLVVDESHFLGGFYQVRLLGQTKNVQIKRSHFKDALGDGIKTERSDTFGPQRVLIAENLFEENNRDGIDTAGGLKDSVIRNNVFFANSQALDIKVVLERETDMSAEIRNSGILIEGGHIIDSRNSIVITYLDRLGVSTVENAVSLMPHDISVRGVTFENSSRFDGRMRAFLIKDGHSIRWQGLTFLGDIQEYSILNEAGVEGWSSYDVGGEVSTIGAPRKPMELLSLLNRYR
ncbi:MAG: right-handed parallel beta-helix repeat-containing protein [Pseudomonadota bacterium]